MKLLVHTINTGYVKTYDSVFRLLAERGHRIHVVFDRERWGREEILAREIAERFPNFTYGRAPRPWAGPWSSLVETIRSLQDSLLYFHPAYRDADPLRSRTEDWMPRPVWRLAGLAGRGGRRAVRAASKALAALDGALPPDPAVERLLDKQRPDALFLTPLVYSKYSHQVDYVKAARARGIPTGLGIPSWDNLTNKGAIRAVPDRVFVWNEAQKAEAVELHGIPPANVAVTGAQIFDEWFAWRPSRTREELCRLVGLDPGRPYVLYLGSSEFIAPDEARFGERWATRLRADDDAVLARAGILIRPHLKNAETWQTVDFSRFGNAVVWPRRGANPLEESFKADFFDSLFYSAAVVGVNSSSLIEAGILGKPVFTVIDPALARGQRGTLHFRYLASFGGGLLHLADSLDEQMDQLRAALRDGGESCAKSRRFVEAFVRPHGLETPATVVVADAVEELAALPISRKTREPGRARDYTVRALTYPLGLLLSRRRQTDRWLKKRPARKKLAKRRRPAERALRFGRRLPKLARRTSLRVSRRLVRQVRRVTRP